MGKSIQRKWFGLPVTNGSRHIKVNGIKFADGTTATNGYIVKQTGAKAYVVRDAADAHAAEICFMVNAASTAALLPGQCFINATPFGGSALPCEKIQQFRLSVYNVANTVPTEVGAPAVSDVSNYSWSTLPAVAVGQADLLILAPPVNSALTITGTGTVGQTLSISANTWTGTAPITFAYQWKRDGVAISGATATTYLLVAGDSTHTVTVTVTATNPDGTASATSNGIAVT
jgi:hypothetical protein